jgi:acetoin:2,6-dichlorophenolindophenol oxidoreductase subunit alpha
VHEADDGSVALGGAVVTAVREAGSVDGVSRAELLEAYRLMRTIRAFEDRLYREFQTGAIPGFVHLYAGEEAIAVGVCGCLRPEDYIASTHRGHGHAIAKGCDPRRMMAEIYGRETGLCRGRGGSMHIADVSKGMLGANGIVGSAAPLITGAALKAKILGTGQVGVAFTGDGGSNQGMFLESLDLASAWRVPAVFVVENNMYAGTTAAAFHQRGVDVARRAAGFDMPGVIADGFDYFDVRRKAGDAIRRARAGEGPTLLECKATRFYGHFIGDPQLYRTPEEIADYKTEHDPIVLFSKRVIEEEVVTSEELAAIDGTVAAAIDEAVALARTDPYPDPSSLLDGVYVSY